MGVLNYQTNLVPASATNEKITTSRLYSNSEKRENMNLSEASTAERKITIRLPKTMPTNTKMGMSFDACL